jgi:hypothetical protein
MNSREIIQIIKKVEKTYHKDFSFNNTDYWPLVRLSILIYFTSLRQEKRNRYKELIFTLIKWLIFNSKYLIQKDKMKDAKVLFVGKSTSLCRVEGSNFIFDRVFDPIINELKKKYLRKIYIDFNYLNFKKMNFPTSNLKRLFNLKILNDNIPFYLEHNLIKLSRKNDIDIDVIVQIFRDEYFNLNNWYNFGNKIFTKYNKIKKIYVYPWYSSSIMGLILASKSFKIKTIDVQHGIQGKYQPMYTHWQKVPKNGYKILPDYFMCWNNKTRVYHHSSSNIYLRKKHTSFINNKSWLNFYKKNFLFRKKFYNPKTLLFCLQPIGNKDEDLIPKFLIKYIESKLSKNINFIFRIHPNDRKSLSNIKKIVKRINNTNKIQIDKGLYNICDSFKKVTHTLTKSSSTGLEAHYFGIRSAVFGKDATENFSQYIKEKKLSIVREDKDSLHKWVISS